MFEERNRRKKKQRNNEKQLTTEAEPEKKSLELNGVKYIGLISIMLLNKSKQIKKCPKRTTTAIKQRNRVCVNRNWIEKDAKWTMDTSYNSLAIVAGDFILWNHTKMHEKKRKKAKKKYNYFNYQLFFCYSFFLTEIAYEVRDWNFT